ncbi:MAG: DUF2341 domain-containing protein, partial [Lachnospiraceae bacterium]|nr:DUF2341 domain-containing protein [Lachnospiraceae bacterium]
MSEYRIFADAACDIPKATLNEWGVSMIDMTFRFTDEEKEHYNSEVDVHDFYDQMRGGRCSRTAAINSVAFLEAFRPVLQQGTDLIYIAFSSGGSTTYEQSLAAIEQLKKDFPERKILAVDALAYSAGLGLTVYLAAKKQQEGASIEEVYRYVEDTRLHVCHWFTVDDLVYLRRGGRVSAATALVVSFSVLATVVPTDFAKKMALTPSATALAKIGETAWTDFPVLVRLPAAVSSQLQTANGTDLYVEDENEASLAFEVESFDPAGTTLVWVKVPSLSSSTKITVYFGGSANADNNPAAVWTRYAGVWHFPASAAGTTTVADATGNSLDGTTTGTISTYAGPFGGDALQSTAKINAPDYDSLLSNVAQFSVSGWFKAPNQSSAYYTFASKKADLNWSADQGWYLEMSQSKTKANLVLTGSNNFDIPDVSANWNYFHLVSDGSTIKVYMNGSTSAAVS